MVAVLIGFPLAAQVEEEGTDTTPDTTRVNVGKTEILIIDHSKSKEAEYYVDEGDTIFPHRKKRHEAHWAGIDFGFSMLMDNSFQNKFHDHPYWKNDPARSQVWNINFLEYKFDIAREYFGFTTGLGFSFTSVAFNNNYVLQETPDTLFAEIDTVYTYSKNKLRASYLTLPVLFEINTHAEARKSFYFAFGVVGGVRLGSSVKRKGEFDGKEFTQKQKGRYSLNAFKLDAAIRLGYSDWGAFANYSLLPLFDDGKTMPVYPLTFGLSYNF